MAAKKSKPALTKKQEIFVCEYCSNGFNASAAARSAGYSSKSAHRSGQDNMQKPLVLAAIDARKDSLSSKMSQYDITDERILKEMSVLAFSNAIDYYNDEGCLIPIHELTRDQAAAISEWRIDKNGISVFKLYDKRTMLDTLAKYKKLYDKNDEADALKQKPPKINIYFPENGRKKKK